MKILFDTSVLVAALVESHPMHSAAFPWLERAQRGEIEACVATHTLAELYSVLTTLPVKPRVSPSMARALIEGVAGIADPVDLAAADYMGVIEQLGNTGTVGGSIYDALISRAAEKARVDRLATFNVRDFKRYWLEDQILNPQLG